MRRVQLPRVRRDVVHVLGLARRLDGALDLGDGLGDGEVAGEDDGVQGLGAGGDAAGQLGVAVAEGGVGLVAQQVDEELEGG